MKMTVRPGLFALAAMLLSLQATASTDRPVRSLVTQLKPEIATSSDLFFIVGGDNRPTGKGAPMPPVLAQIFSEFGLIRPDFVVWTGDTIYGYGDTPAELSAEYDVFTRAAAAGGVPLFNAPGNHEIRPDAQIPCHPNPAEKEFVRRFGNLYGSFDAGGAHFILLDADLSCDEAAIAGDEKAWLERDLESNKSARAIFVFSHEEFFSSPWIDPPAGADHPAISNRDELHALFRKYPVKAVFSGHEHLFWREPAEKHDGIEYFTAGGGGAPLYAPPERGGFSHYIVVRLSGEKLTYDVIEPGHLSVSAARPGKKGEKSFWLLNSNDADLPVRGLEVTVPGAIGPCPALAARTDLHKRDGTPVPVAVSISSCTDRHGARKVRLAMTAPRRTSVPVVLSRKTPAASSATVTALP